ncbi:MAG: DJ-1/PfpI family protein [Muribaculaceae bacterium]|jgi:protein deglycase|nr:DJ-1/PfpI family protein [Muribaculaceae bacterium]
MMNNKVYILLAEGFEIIEALTPVDVMRRCKIPFATVSIADSPVVTASCGVSVSADLPLSGTDFSDGAVLVLPGGYPGYVNLRDNAAVGNLVHDFYSSQRFIAAICGAPSVLAHCGIAAGCRVTCHRSVADRMNAYDLVPDRLVRDGKIITAAGAGISLEFSIAIASLLVGDDVISHLRMKLELEP